MSREADSFIFWPLMAALGHLMDSLFSEALVIMQSAVGPVPRGLGCFMDPLSPVFKGPPECEPVGKALPQ